MPVLTRHDRLLLHSQARPSQADSDMTAATLHLRVFVVLQLIKQHNDNSSLLSITSNDWGNSNAAPFQEWPSLRRLQSVCICSQVFVASVLMERHHDNSSTLCSVACHQCVCVCLQVFVASALMEWHYDNSSAKVPNNIWEMGAKRFMAQPGFALAYIGFQLGLGDTANARATFERALTVTPPEEAQPLWDGYLKFEVQVL